MQASPLPIDVRTDDLSSLQVQALIAEHLAGMHNSSPAGHVHALAIDALKAPDMTFWTAWTGDQLCGCGAMKSLSAAAGEVKSMRTQHSFLRRGVAQAVLNEIERTARLRGYTHLYLETGSGEPFSAAQGLYLRNGFVYCGPFGAYTANDFSVFMVKELTSANAPNHLNSAI